MKTYNLTSGTLYAKRDGVDCFCALGIFAAERGCPIEQLEADDYSFFGKPELQEDIAKMATVLNPISGIRDDWGDDDDDESAEDLYSQIHFANDLRDWHKWDSASGSGKVPYRVPAEKIQEALAAVGIKVELKDKRGQW
jgi:hypothetical protein